MRDVDAIQMMQRCREEIVSLRAQVGEAPGLHDAQFFCRSVPLLDTT